ncbi:MAG: type II toxin-antitoxin system HicB family antitoxin [Mariprofundales bacterium]|nr:type II toxin-antitoxin system HicB family antitoxin [Mariprofundales bacterium]
MLRFTYPVTLTQDETDGGFVVTFPDLPEAITQGDTIEQCLSDAVDCLDEAIAGRVDDGDAIPQPSVTVIGDMYKVACPIHTAIKAALYIAVKDAGISKRELGRRLGVDEKVARRLLDPHYHGRLPAMERALRQLGKVPELSIR